MYVQALPSSDLNVVFNEAAEGPLVVELPQGVTFRQKVVVGCDDLTVIGNGSTIVWDDHNGMSPGFGTGDSATLCIKGRNVVFRDLVVENSFDYLKARRQREEDPSSMMGLQAVAVFVEPSAGDVSFQGCRLLGWQDTLFADGRSCTFQDCFIRGNVDFVFGRSNALFHGCTIESCGAGFVAAPSTMEGDDGFVFEDCTFICDDAVDDGGVYLARPWHPGGRPGVRSAAVFRDCRFARHVNRDLWTSMRDSKGVVHTPDESRFIVDRLTCRWV